MTISRAILISFLLSVMVSHAFAQNNVGPLVLDPAFAIGGKSEVGFGADSAVVTSWVAYKPIPGQLNRILLAGKIYVNDSIRFGIAEYDSSGVPESGFGTNGREVVPHSGITIINAVCLLPNGKILATGATGSNIFLFRGEPIMFRLNSNGTLDSSFEKYGSIVSPTPQNIGELVNIDTVHLAGDTSIRYVAMGYLNVDRDGFYAMRRMSDGSEDTSFGSGGESIGGAPVQFGQGHLIPGGKIIFVGITDIQLTQTKNPEISLCRLLANGSPDSSFGMNSVLNTGIALQNNGTISSVYDPDSLKSDPYRSLIVCTQLNGDLPFTLLKFKLDGTLDSNFGKNGYATSPIISNMTPQGITISNDGSILVCGSLGNVSAATKFFLNGTLDATFGVKGVAILDPDSGKRTNFLIGFLPASLPPPHPPGGGQRFLGIGTSVNASGNDEFLLARYMPASAGVREQETSTGNATVYPNPAHSFVYIESKRGPIQHITITDALGRIIEDFSKPSYATESETYDLDVSGLAAGTYNCLVRTPEGISDTRFTVLH